MKHKLSITLLLLSMFLVTQFIGIVVLNEYAPTTTDYFNETSNKYEVITERESLPFGMENDEELEPASTLLTIITSLIFAILIYAFLMRYNLKLIIRLWFMLVIFLALGLTLFPFISKFSNNASLIALMIATPLVYYKIIKPNVYVHNITELLIYPGIAAVIVSVLFLPSNIPASILISIILLVLISLYDAWAVWKSGIMQKMAKYQMEELNIFGGFLIPSINKKDRERIKALKLKYKNKTEIAKKVKQKKIKVNLAILGGGDVIFPIITAGIFMWAFPEQMLFSIKGLIPALFIIFGATIGLVYLFLNTKKGKAYPAMPYISTGIFIGMILWKILI